MYLNINNFEKILDAPHPTYTCIGCDTKGGAYIFDVSHDETIEVYTIFIQRQANIDGKYPFRIEGAGIIGIEHGVLESSDFGSRTLLFKLLCHAIDEIKSKF